MSRAEIYIDASPHAVFEILADPRSYSHWVVGSREIRAADGTFPQAGTAFDHRIGGGPLTVADHTDVVASLPPVMLELRAHAGPLGTARVTLELTPDGDGSRVLLIEEPANPLLTVAIGPLGHALLKLRGMEMLRRLRDLAEGRQPRPEGELPDREALRCRP